MTNKNVSIEDLEGYLPEIRLFGHHSKDLNKALDMVVNPVTEELTYAVTKDNKLEESTTSLDSAIELYNNL